MLLDEEKNRCIESNRAEYPESYHLFRWPSANGTLEAEARRRELIAAMQDHPEFKQVARAAKLYSHALAPGCSHCLAMTWSCLFINNICNASCFYCPSPQSEREEPQTNFLRFAKTRDYADYLVHFGFKGVSISGGEPLMTFDRSLAFLSEVKKRLGEKVHTWLYTNGILLDREKVIRLKYAGLDEIRFDIGATGYSLEKIKLAFGDIPHITVEIPAVPGDCAKMKVLMRQMVDVGVQYLNLHQMRCTPFNCQKILERGEEQAYTFLHGRKVTVLESELVALELLLHGLEQKIPLAVNYCSFVYKNRFQALAARQRAVNYLCKPWEDVTPAGYIRRLWVEVTWPGCKELVETLQGQLSLPGRGEVNSEGTRLYLKSSLLDLVIATCHGVLIGYDEVQLRPHPTFRQPCQEIVLNGGRKLVAERVEVVKERWLSMEEVVMYKKGLESGDGLAGGLAGLSEYEAVPGGLAQYY